MSLIFTVHRCSGVFLQGWNEGSVAAPSATVETPAVREYGSARGGPAAHGSYRRNSLSPANPPVRVISEWPRTSGAQPVTRKSGWS